MGLKAKKTRRKSKELEEVILQLKKEPTRRFNADVPILKLKAFHIKAISEGKTMSEVLLTWIDEYLSK